MKYWAPRGHLPPRASPLIVMMSLPLWHASPRRSPSMPILPWAMRWCAIPRRAAQKKGQKKAQKKAASAPT
jgi:hypothetical protein